MFDEQNLPGCLWLKSRETEKGQESTYTIIHPSIHLHLSAHNLSTAVLMRPASSGFENDHSTDQLGSQPSRARCIHYKSCIRQAPRPHIV